MRNMFKYILGGLLVGTIAVAATNRVWESQEWLSGQITTPSNPSAGKFKFYFKSDGDMYKLNSSGVEEQVGGGGSAAEVTFASSGTIVASNVQDALQELDSDIVAHLGDTADAHDASAISNVASGTISATTVQLALEELDTEKAPIASPTFTGTATAPTVLVSGLTASRAVTTDGSKNLASSSTTSTELGYVNGVTRALQTQLNEKAEGRNILLNPNFELSTNWTASGGATTAINSTAVGTGTNGYDWNSNGAAQTLSSDSVTIPNGMQGKSGVVSCAIKTVSGTATHTLQAYDGSNIVGTATITSTTASFARTALNFVFPTSGSIVLRLVSVAADEPEIYIDDCYMGLAEGFNVGAISQFGEWTSYTPSTTQGFGTPTGTSYYRTTPQGVQIRFAGTVGTVTGSQGRWGLPTGCTTASTYFANGSWVGSGGVETTSINVTVLAAPSVTYINFGGVYAGTAGGVIATGSTIATNNDDFSFFADVQCAGYSSNTVYRPETNAAYYSGYFDSTCGGWTVTNTAFTAFTADASCALVSRSSSGITAATTGSVLPALALTLPRTGQYQVCAQFVGTGAGATMGWQLYDGTNALAENHVTVGSNTPVTLCGILNATTTTPTISIRGKSTSGAVTINSGGFSSALQFDVYPITGNMPAPVLVGSVTSASTGTIRMEAATLAAPSGGACAVTEIGGSDWINGNCTSSGTGICTCTLNSGIFSAAPLCQISVVNLAAANSRDEQITSTSTSTIVTFTATTGGTAVNNDVGITCMGAR